MTFHKQLLALPLLVLGCPADDDAGDDAADTGASTGDSGASSPTESGGEGCTPGQIESCLCPDMTGSTQICLADGSGFSACDCVGGSADDDSGDSASSVESSGEGETSGGASSDDGPIDTGTEAGSTGPMPECDGSSHPLVDGELRYCEPGNCYCGDFSVDPPYDTCYMEAIAEPCCPVEVVCY